MPNVNCIICGLNQSSSAATCDVPMHKLPKKRIKRILWCESLNITAEILSTRKYILVCGRHFNPSQYSIETLKDPMRSKRILKSDAVPTLKEPSHWNKMFETEYYQIGTDNVKEKITHSDSTSNPTQMIIIQSDALSPEETIHNAYKIKTFDHLLKSIISSDKSSTKSELSPADKTFTLNNEPGISTNTNVIANLLKNESEAEACDDQQKFVIFTSQIHQLFKCCQVEGCGKLAVITFSHRGGVVHMHWCCKEGHKGNWTKVA